MDNELPRVIVDERGSGKTTVLLEWLMAGERFPRWPHWSRLVIVSSSQLKEHYLRQFREIDRILRDRGTEGFEALLVTWDEAQRLRGIDRRTEFALDDLDVILWRVLGRVSLMTVSGTPLSIAELRAENEAVPEPPPRPTFL